VRVKADHDVATRVCKRNIEAGGSVAVAVLDDDGACLSSEVSGTVNRASVGDDQLEAVVGILLENRTDARLDVLVHVTRRNNDRDARARLIRGLGFGITHCTR
jgi:hypothetical protein